MIKVSEAKELVAAINRLKASNDKEYEHYKSLVIEALEQFIVTGQMPRTYWL